MQVARARVRGNGAETRGAPRTWRKRPVPCEEMRKKPAIVIVNDKIQSGYTYVLTEPRDATSIRNFGRSSRQEKCCAWASSAAST